MFNELADIISNEEEKTKRCKKNSFKSLTINTFKKDSTKDNKTKSNKVNKAMTQNSDKVNKSIKCRLCKNKRRLMNCEQFLSKSFIEKKEYANKEKLCFDCLAKGQMLKEGKSNFFCRMLKKCKSNFFCQIERC